MSNSFCIRVDLFKRRDGTPITPAERADLTLLLRQHCKQINAGCDTSKVTDSREPPRAYLFIDPGLFTHRHLANALVAMPLRTSKAY
jgi:hypothetical protein